MLPQLEAILQASPKVISFQIQEQAIYVRLVITLRTGRQFTSPPVTLSEVRQYHADLLRDGRR